ncbi:glycosyl hydrolase family 18 protein [Aquimarina algicola]|uniref:chitinase n=1 Tax=Aquimarina algicola TaxID=2589995 RepID=A0A504JIA7_9FLAO|nr:glycosyl hydrolase family 18 protein [Aquimarina algicola]TPN86221.1 hypothetical protein FHK87_13200 [Aquimarina algicola]
MHYKTIPIIAVLYVFLCHNYAFSSTISERVLFFQDTSKVIKKASKKLKLLKKLFHHDDSTKLGRKFIHQHHKQLRDKKVPTFETNIDDGDTLSSFFTTASNFELGYEVLGWYPYWEKDYYKNINFSLLSTIAYFSYEVDPTSGNAISTHDWETTALIDSIRTYPNKRILLTVSNFGEKNNRKLLRNPDAIDTLVKNLITLLSKRQGDGVCIDFEGVHKSEKDKYTGFLLTLSNALKKANKNYKVYITLPSVNWAEALDFKALNQAVDTFVIMGYDYYGATSTVAGPVSPLESEKTWEPYNLTSSVDYYLKNSIPAEKLILALPTYGSLWQTENQSLQSKVKKYIGSRTYSYIKSNIENNESFYIEPISKSAYSAYRIQGKKTEYRQCWFENDSSFIYKTQFIKDKKLKGLGLWALGYDKGYDGLWKVISTELAKPVDSTTTALDDDGQSSSLVSGITKALGLTDPDSKINRVEKKLVSITNYKTILLYILSFVLFFGCLGFLGAMFYPNTRAGFFNDPALKSYYITLMLIIAIVVFRMLGWIDDGIVMLIIGFVLGVVAFYFANKIIEKRRKDLP